MTHNMYNTGSRIFQTDAEKSYFNIMMFLISKSTVQKQNKKVVWIDEAALY